MSIDKQETVIDGIHVCVVQWTARTAIKNKIKLGIVLGPVLKQLGPLLAKGKQALEEDVLVLVDIFEKLAIQLEDSKFDKFVEMVFSTTFLNDREFSWSEFDTVFTGKILSFYKTIFFALEVNYKSFLDEMGIGKAREQRNQKPKK